jgi:predicted O-methyltransferase YrrM
MTIAGRLTSRIPPDAPLANAGHRLLLAIAARRLPDDAPSGAALGRALRDTASARFSRAEREWISRIETHREQLAQQYGHDGAGRWSPPSAWSMPRVWGRLLFRLVRELEPRTCIELGAGFGVSALYQAAALELNGEGRLRTLDREGSLIPIATGGFAEHGLDHRIELVRGPIGETLDQAATEISPIDYALIDAEHTEAATVFNFDTLRPHLAPNALVVVDDILSTDEMRRAWATIEGRPNLGLTLNLRRIGLVVVG